MKQKISKHFVIKNGKLLPRDVDKDKQLPSTNQVRYTHNISYLYSRQTYSIAQDYEIKLQKLQQRLKDAQNSYNEQIYNLNKTIQSNQKQMYEQNRQIQHLKKLLRLQKSNISKGQKNNIYMLGSQFNDSSKYSPATTQRSCNRSNYNSTSQKCEQILDRVQKSENTLKYLQKILEPYQKLIIEEDINSPVKLKTEFTTSGQQSDEVENQDFQNQSVKQKEIKGNVIATSAQYSPSNYKYESKQYFREDYNSISNLHKSQIMREAKQKPISETEKLKTTRIYQSNKYI